MLSVCVSGADSPSRRATEQRISAIHGLRVVYGGPRQRRAADVLVVAAEREGHGLARCMATGAEEHPPVLVVVDEPFEGLLPAVLALGVHGIVLSSAPDRELADCAALVARGCTVIPSWVLDAERLRYGQRGSPRTARPHDSRAALAGLSGRELEVLRLVGAGRSNPEIAEELWLSSNTVRSHVQRLIRKLGTRDRAGLIILAHELDLVDHREVAFAAPDRERPRPAARAGAAARGGPAATAGSAAGAGSAGVPGSGAAAGPGLTPGTSAAPSPAAPDAAPRPGTRAARGSGRPG
jgi:DNA-binding NarL/FixJ family response regulator